MIEWWVIALVSAFFSATAAIVEKKILFKEKALSMTLILGIFNLILAIPFFFFVDYSVLAYSGILVLLFKSVLGAIAFLFVMMGIRDLELSRVLPLLVLTPGLVAVFAFLFLGEVLMPFEIGGLVLLLFGTYLLQLNDRRGFFAPWKSFVQVKGYCYILTALILYTTTSVLDKAVLKNYGVPLNAFMGFQHLFLAFVFVIIALFYSKGSDLKKTFKFSWWMILILAVITITYRYTFYYAVRVAPVALVLSLKRVSVFFAVLIGGKLFREKNLKRRAVATAIIIIGSLLIILN